MYSIGIVSANALNIEVSSYVFGNDKKFIEVYFRVDARTIKWVKSADNIGYSASVQFVLIAKEKGEIKAFDKFDLTSTTLDTLSDLITVKRMAVTPGAYQLGVTATDVYNEDNKLELEQIILVNKLEDKVLLSDILLLGDIHKDDSDNSMVKSGYYMEPLSYSFVDSTVKQLNIFIEATLAPAISANKTFLQFSINEGFKDIPLKTTLFTKAKKLTDEPFQPTIFSLPSNNLKSGNYHLQVNVIDEKRNILATKATNFVVSNPAVDIAFLENYNESVDNSFVQSLKAEDMDYIFKAHVPITEQHQVSTLSEVLKGSRIKSQRQFLYQYWKQRAPSNPQEAYAKYMEVAEAVNKKFYCNVGYGFQSDRGHIFLKHGAPTNVITIDNELDAPPYEIWYYNQTLTTRQTNVRFLFYNPSLSTNDFHLLHSNCIGERNNPAWETVLYKSVPLERKGPTVDATQVGENWNRNARRYFNDY